MKLTKLVLLMVVVVMIASCGEKQGTQPADTPSQPPATTPPEPEPADEPPGDDPEEVTLSDGCSSLGGEVCSSGENCPGEWLDASDSFRCCSADCEANEQKEFPSFDFGEDDDSLGSLGS